MRKWQKATNEGISDTIIKFSKRAGSFLFDPLAKRVRDILDGIKKESDIKDNGWMRSENGDLAIRVSSKGKNMDIICHSNGTSISYKEDAKGDIKFDDDFLTVASLRRFEKILCDYFHVPVPLTSSADEEELEEAFTYKIKDIMVRSLIWQVFYLAKKTEFSKYKVAVKGTLKNAYLFFEDRATGKRATIDVERECTVFAVRLYTKDGSKWHMDEVETDDAQVALDKILEFFKNS